MRTPPNNDCFFTALGLAVGKWEQTPRPSDPQALANLGRLTRREFLKHAQRKAEKGFNLHGLPLAQTLIDRTTTPESGPPNQVPPQFLEYLRRMTVGDNEKPTVNQWGGFAEAQAAACMWDVALYIVGAIGDNKYQLFTESYQPDKPKRIACLVYSGNCHFDTLIVSSLDVLLPLDGTAAAARQSGTSHGPGSS